MVGSKIWKVVQCEREWEMAGEEMDVRRRRRYGDSFRGCGYVLWTCGR